MLHQIFILNKNFEKHFKEYNFHKLYKELVNFCSLDLSALYFDIRKDILYCDEIKSSNRQIVYEMECRIGKCRIGKIQDQAGQG